jgi:hypothetical protein
MAKTKNVRTKKATAAYVSKMAGIRERREKWLKALESGRYKQTTGQLRDVQADYGTASYCCLGVLCNIEKEKGQKWEVDTFIGGVSMLPDFEGNMYPDEDRYYDMPPTNIMDKLNLSEDLASALAQMNDNGSTFKEIAAFLRKKWRMPKA